MPRQRIRAERDPIRVSTDGQPARDVIEVLVPVLTVAIADLRPLESRLVTDVSLEDVRRYDPKTRAVMESAEREPPRGLPVAMASGPPTIAFRVLAWATTAFGIAAFAAGWRPGYVFDFWKGDPLLTALVLLALLSFGLFAALLAWLSLTALMVYTIMAVIGEVSRLTALFRGRRYASLLARAAYSISIFPVAHVVRAALALAVMLGRVFRGDSDQELGEWWDALCSSQLPQDVS
jgi:hypothetical protein